VAVPKATSAPLELLTVARLPPGLAEAPEKTRLWDPA
jgi:hypothetical protein